MIDSCFSINLTVPLGCCTDAKWLAFFLLQSELPKPAAFFFFLFKSSASGALTNDVWGVGLTKIIQAISTATESLHVIFNILP